MTLEEQISNNYKQAMKDRDTAKSAVLSFLRAQLKNMVIDKRVEKLDDADVIVVIKKQLKQQQDSLEQFEKGGRADLIEKQKFEISVLKAYLPPEMSADELKVLVDEAVKESGATAAKDMGKVMKIILPKVAGKADSKAVSDLVKERLSRI
ncbi:MAG: GatB/YqeY domain-containing protein [Candidatus Omnitrophota bacterium]